MCRHQLLISSNSCFWPFPICLTHQNLAVTGGCVPMEWHRLLLGKKLKTYFRSAQSTLSVKHLAREWTRNTRTEHGWFTIHTMCCCNYYLCAQVSARCRQSRILLVKNWRWLASQMRICIYLNPLCCAFIETPPADTFQCQLGVSWR